MCMCVHVCLRAGGDVFAFRCMGQVDQFTKVHDFARAYGSLCWNLSKVIPRKDLPRWVAPAIGHDADDYTRIADTAA